MADTITLPGSAPIICKTVPCAICESDAPEGVGLCDSHWREWCASTSAQLARDTETAIRHAWVGAMAEQHKAKRGAA